MLRHRKPTLLLQFFGLWLVVLLCFNWVSADLIVPPATSGAFIQTTGPFGDLGIGDYRANQNGDFDDHVLSVNIACEPGVTYTFELFDPAVDAVGNAIALDEPRPDAASPDNTSYDLRGPGGASLTGGFVTFTPGTSAGAWTTLYTLGPTTAADCGEYALHARTADNDENGWQFRLRGINASAVPFEGDEGPDGIIGTGDEAFVVLSAVSYQHRDVTPQLFYWFSNDGDSNMFMLNFDLDGNISTRYIAPDGTITQGTVSNNALWNNAAPQQARPTYGQMINCSGGPPCDAFDNPMPGLWSAEIAVNILNQYSFEVPGRQLFLEPPQLPQVIITKTDNVTTVPSPGVSSYTIEIENIGVGAAMPIPGPEVVDTLPPGMTFVSCSVNAPLVGTCAPVGNTIEFNLDPQVGARAYLLGSGAGAGRRGTLTVNVNIDPGLPDATQLENVATVDYTDIFGNNHPPSRASDLDVVSRTPNPNPGGPPVGTGNNNNGGGAGFILVDPFITKSVQPPFALPGEAATWTITVTNPSGSPVNNLSITDTMPPEVEILSVSASAGSASFNGQVVSFTLATLNPGQSVSVTVNTRVRPGVAVPFTATNQACMSASNAASSCASATIASVSALPQTGERPPVFGAAVLVLVLLLANGLLLTKAGKRSA